MALSLLTACGPHAHIPLRPANLPDALAPTDSGALLARRLAPVLYLQRDETFPLERVVAVLYPIRRVIAYHLLWRDDVHGSWIPFTVPTDEEVLWVGYDSTYAPTDVWTYWYGQILHTVWPRSQVAIDVQWGKHGSLPRNVRQSDLPRPRTLNFFYAMTIFGEPDNPSGRCYAEGAALLLPQLPQISAIHPPDPSQRQTGRNPQNRGSEAYPSPGIRQQVLEQASLALDKKSSGGTIPPELSILSFQSAPFHFSAFPFTVEPRRNLWPPAPVERSGRDPSETRSA